MDDYNMDYSDYLGDINDENMYGWSQTPSGMGEDYFNGLSGWGNYDSNFYDSLSGLLDNSSFSQDALSNITGGGYPTTTDLSGYLKDIQDENMQGWGNANTGSTGSISQTLQKLFTNPALLSKGLGALVEGYQNKKNANTLTNAANSTKIDPFGSQRAQYQQELQNTVQNPYSSAIVKSQVDNLQRQQAIKDAAAGRRSNSLSSAPSVLAAQAQIAQNYMNQLGTLAGANIAPSSSSYANLMSNAANSGTNSYTSPLLYALTSALTSNGSNKTGSNNSNNSNYANSLLSFLFGQ